MNTNDLTRSTLESRKIKCKNHESAISNIPQPSIIKSSSNKLKKNQNKKMSSTFSKKKTVTKNVYNDKTTKTDDDITHEKENDDDINNLSVGLMSLELFIII